MDFIGVIDSGVGGLTVLRQLAKSHSYNYMYVADHAFCPYGTKPNNVILERACKLACYLQSQGAQAVVLACNTMSTFVSDVQSVCNVPVYDVILPTCQFVTDNPTEKRVALLATRSTISNGAYQSYLAKHGVEVVGFDCSAFVPYIEQRATTTISCLSAVHNALRNLSLMQADAVILGCTHFPLLRAQIAHYCADDKIVECRCSLPNNICAKALQPTITYLTTGNADFANNASHWYANAQFSHIDL